jgi:hypothetical protein
MLSAIVPETLPTEGGVADAVADSGRERTGESVTAPPPNKARNSITEPVCAWLDCVAARKGGKHAMISAAEQVEGSAAKYGCSRACTFQTRRFARQCNNDQTHNQHLRCREANIRIVNK